jgi:hypothetical protein
MVPLVYVIGPMRDKYTQVHIMHCEMGAEVTIRWMGMSLVHCLGGGVERCFGQGSVNPFSGGGGYHLSTSKLQIHA